MLRVACPSCAEAYQVAEQSLGNRVQCKSCGQTFTLAIARDETFSRSQPLTGPSAPLDTREQTEHRLIPGNQLAQYILKSKLGAGAMGEVWLARDPHLERDVAVKVLPVAVAHDAERRERFAREAKFAARLHHSNAVTVYQFGVEEQQVFIAMELVDGRSLDKVVKENGPLDWRSATNVICDAARGLAAAHDIGLVHRDIKPANLMRTTKGVTKVVDFGLAREQLADPQFTQQGMLLGTPAYMAPEQWAGGIVDGRSDLYSLICTYYYLLIGALPFEATNFAALGYQHRYEPLPDPRQRCPALPDRVIRILARGAEKQPGDRYQTAAELVADLEALLAAPDAPIIATSSSAPANQSLPRGASQQVLAAVGWARAWWFAIQPRTRGIIAAGVASALLLLCGIIVLIPTPKGTVKIEIDDPQAIVVVDREKITVERLGEPIELRTGAHELIVRRGDVLVETRSFTVVKGDNPVLKITLLEPPAPLTPEPATSPPPKPEQVAESTPAPLPPSTPPTPKPLPVTPTPAPPTQSNEVSAESLTNSIGTKLALIPAGEFLMGSPDSDRDAESDEKPQHRVTITKPFYLGVYEVTQAEYQRVMGTNPSSFSTAKVGQDTSQHPVETVSWADAVEFCRQLSELPKEKAAGRIYRLPTEAEWEYACRAGSATKFSFGDSESQLGDYAWYNSNSGSSTHPVGQNKPNAFGLYDMHGNVCEWCADWFESDYYSSSPVGDPKGPASALNRILRGGSFNYRATLTRAADRGWLWSGSHVNDNGFRLARTP